MIGTRQKATPYAHTNSSQTTLHSLSLSFSGNEDKREEAFLVGRYDLLWSNPFRIGLYWGFEYQDLSPLASVRGPRKGSQR